MQSQPRRFLPSLLVCVGAQPCSVLTCPMLCPQAASWLWLERNTSPCCQPLSKVLATDLRLDLVLLDHAGAHHREAMYHTLSFLSILSTDEPAASTQELKGARRGPGLSSSLPVWCHTFFFPPFTPPKATGATCPRRRPLLPC